MDHAKLITASVGRQGADEARDVARVRKLLQICGRLVAAPEAIISSAMPRSSSPVTAELCLPGAQTDLATAISIFQREVVRMRNPDGRIDPGGLSEAMLIAEARQTIYLGSATSLDRGDERVNAVLCAPIPNVKKGSIEKADLISSRTIAALRLLGHCVGLPEMVITDGIRSYATMARYFLTGITKGSSGTRGKCYAEAVKIMTEHNAGKAWTRSTLPAKHRDALAKKMEEICTKDGRRVSNHVVSEADYRKMNVLDLGYNSNPLLKEKLKARVFARLLDAFHRRNPQATHPFVRQYHPPHFMNRVLDDSLLGVELRKENAWHLEFTVANIPSQA